MATAIDLTKPSLTDTYTAFQAEIVTAIQMLASGLDPTYATPSNQPTGTKRFNSGTGLFEQWNGTTWAVLSVSYLQTTSAGTQTVTGTVNFSGTLQTGGAAVASQSYVTTQLASYAPLASPNFSGTPALAGAALATQAYVGANAPTLTGGGASGTWGINVTGSSASCTGNASTATSATTASTATTRGSGDNSTNIATTAFVQAATVSATSAQHNPTGSRAFGSAYTPSASKPTFVSVTGTLSSGSAYLVLSCGGTVYYSNITPGFANQLATVCGFVAAGQSYTVTVSTGTATINAWNEFN